ncbi:MAG TPA: 3-deoxy-8-phosphooctulonate synthase [Thermodesulfovibrionia bacterium]|nr:3-deoxy-8-phosphooctulonate synthase [Thermodesulfovibrionia bacterium]
MISPASEIPVSDFLIGGHNSLVLVAGPCVIETEESTLKTAAWLKEFCQQIGVPFIFKSSYDKANRTSADSYRGPGLKKGLEILKKVKDELGIPLLSDVHLPQEADPAAAVLDIIQIPAFLCRQTDLLFAVADTGKPVNVKKGQFLAPHDISQIIAKVLSRGNPNILITERGVSFGYNNLVVDMRAISIMKDFGVPVMFDATHSVQLPGGAGTCSGGQSQFVAPLARAAVAVGCDALFMEVHEFPSKALCDGPNMLSLKELSELMPLLLKIDSVVCNRD